MEVKVSRGHKKSYSKLSNKLKKNVEKSVKDTAMELKSKVEARTPVDTGLLKSSFFIDYKVSNGTYTATLANKQKYLTYVINGTGKYNPSGRSTPWVYRDSRGNFRFTEGMRPNDFITPTVMSYKDTLRNNVKTAIKNTFRGE